jgi:putative ABC transport system substrate-binding protein
MRRRELMLLLGGMMTAARTLRAQQKPMPVIGWLDGGSSGPNSSSGTAFRQGLSETGYVEGQNLAIEYRSAEDRYDRLPALAADPVDSKVDVIATGGLPLALAAKSATSTIPIVFIIGTDPVELGLVASLARPGGNLTGIAIMATELMPKRLELLRQRHRPTREPKQRECRAPDARRAAGVAREGSTAAYPEGEHRKRDRHRLRDLRPTAGRRARRRDRSLLYNRREHLVALASRHAVLTMYEFREFAAAGGLISYGPSLTGTWRQVGIYVGQILKGAKPADLPVRQPTTFELVVNLKTAKALGLTVPRSILARADEVIE